MDELLGIPGMRQGNSHHIGSGKNSPEPIERMNGEVMLMDSFCTGKRI